MNVLRTKTEQILELHKIELKTQQFKELDKNDKFNLLLKFIEESWTYKDKGYGVK